MTKVCYWDSAAQCQKERDMTPDEEAQRLIDMQPTPDQHNAPILAQLMAIDAKSIRALREGDQVRIAALESQAAALRSQLMKA